MSEPPTNLHGQEETVPTGTQGPAGQPDPPDSACDRLPPLPPATVPSLNLLGAAAPLAALPEPPPFPSVPGYEILGTLGRGGMGVVYQARHLRLNRTVALKMVLHGVHSDPQALERFRAEAEAVARLQHPNIVQVYEVGEVDGLPFFALEYVGGGSVRRELAGKPVPPAGAAELVETLARAVHAAHLRGVVHRDLKPANVLLTTEGVPKIADFGLAKRLDEGAGAVASPQTQTGAILGTPAYMPPEQAAGRVREVGPLADVYALGAILYELLTGRPPFLAATPMDTVLQVLRQEPVPPRRLAPQVPRDLETVRLRCLEKAPARRYPSARALAEDLRRFLDGKPTVARPVGLWGRATRWAKRHPGVAALSAAVFLVALAGLGTVIWKWQEAEQAREAEVWQRHKAQGSEARAVERAAAAARASDEATRARGEEARQRARAEDARREAETQLYRSHLDLAHREWLGGHAARAVELLNECPPADRRWEWHYLKRQLGAGVRTLVCDTRRIAGVSLSPDGKLLAVACPDTRAIELWDPAAGRLLRRLGGPQGHAGAVTAVAFRPDGLRIASAGLDGTVRFWDPATGAQFGPLRHGAGVTCLAFGPDGKRLAVGDTGKEVTVWDLSGGKEPVRLAGCPDRITCVAFSPDGKQVAAGSNQVVTVPGVGGARTVRLWDAASGAEVVVLEQAVRGVMSLAFSPDGRRFATGSIDYHLGVYDTGTGKLVDGGSLALDHVVLGVAWSPDGTRLAAACGNQTVTVCDSRTFQELFTFRGHDVRVVGVAWSPDGTRLTSAGADGVVKIWDATAAQDAVTAACPGQPGYCSGGAWSPDGRQIVVGWGPTVYTWDVTERRAGPPLRGHGAPVAAVACSPGGKYVASADTHGAVKLWDRATGRELPALEGRNAQGPGGPRYQAAVAFSADERRLAWADTTGAVRVWDAATGRALFQRTGRLQNGHCVAFSPDGTRLAWGDGVGNITVWDVAAGKQILALFGQRAKVLALSFDPTGRLLASADSQVRLWDLSSARQLHVFTAHSEAAAKYLAFSPDGRRLVTSAFDKSVRVWDVSAGRQLLSLRGPRGALYGLGFSPDGRYLAASAGYELRIWEGTPGREITLHGSTGMILGVAFSPALPGDVPGDVQGRFARWRLASAEQLTVNVWEADSGRTALLLPWLPPSERREVLSHSPDIAACVAFSPDGASLAAGGETAVESGTIKIWETGTGRLLRAMRGHGAVVFSVAFSPDGRRLASASPDGTARVWDTATGTELLAFRGHAAPVSGVAFLPGGGRLASCGQDRAVRVWDAATGAEVCKLGGHNGSVVALAIAPGGKRLAAVTIPRAAGEHGEAVVWDVGRGERLLTFRGHTGPVYTVAFSPDGRLVASAGDDRVVRVWDSATGRECLALRGHHHRILRLAFSPDGRFVASCSQDRTVRVWDVTGCEPGPAQRAKATASGG